MAARRPLVLDASNRIGELPAADSLVGMPVYLRIGLRSGATASLPLSTDYRLAIGLQAGGTATIQATLT